MYIRGSPLIKKKFLLKSFIYYSKVVLKNSVKLKFESIISDKSTSNQTKYDSKILIARL